MDLPTCDQRRKPVLEVVRRVATGDDHVLVKQLRGAVPGLDQCADGRQCHKSSRTFPVVPKGLTQVERIVDAHMNDGLTVVEVEG